MLELVARHPEIDAIVYLGLGIQSNQARLVRAGGFYPDHGLERIVAYHERQDARFAQAAADIADATGKPILTATELAIADARQPRARRPSAPPAASATRRRTARSTALGHLWRYARFRQTRGLA